MSRKEGVLLASRVLALYFFCWALDNLSYLPIHLFALVHHFSEGSVLTGGTYLYRYYLGEVLLFFARFLVFIGAAWWCYRGGPWLQAFLLPAGEVNTPDAG